MTQVFSLTELERLTGCLGRLLPHVHGDGVAITGGVAMQLGMAELGRRGLRNGIADLDLVAASIEVISPSVVGQFLLSHYHVVRPGVPKFMIQLVDPVSRIRIDIFPDLVRSLMDARTIAIGEHTVHVLPLARILDHKVRALSRASSSSPIDPKHVHDALALGHLLGRQVPAVAPAALACDVFGIEADCFCERCKLSEHPRWPLAPKDRIFELLGWTRQPNMPLVPSSGSAGFGQSDGIVTTTRG